MIKAYRLHSANWWIISLHYLLVTLASFLQSWTKEANLRYQIRTCWYIWYNIWNLTKLLSTWLWWPSLGFCGGLPAAAGLSLCGCLAGQCGSPEPSAPGREVYRPLSHTALTCTLKNPVGLEKRWTEREKWCQHVQKTAMDWELQGDSGICCLGCWSENKRCLRHW